MVFAFRLRSTRPSNIFLSKPRTVAARGQDKLGRFRESLAFLRKQNRLVSVLFRKNHKDCAEENF